MTKDNAPEGNIEINKHKSVYDSIVYLQTFASSLPEAISR